MKENVFESLLKEKIDNFKLSFSETSEKLFFNDDGTLIHPGEFGRYREESCMSFIRQIIPSKLGIGQGFVINTYNHISHQCDIVIYDKSSSLPLVSTDNQFFYPIESVAAVGEVKSKLSKELFENAIVKLSEIKVLREEIKTPVVISNHHIGIFNPVINPYDQVFTFLICKKLDFNYKNLPNELDKMYGTTEPRHRHNLILSIDDGLLAYYDKNDKTLMYPVIKENLKNRFITPSDNTYAHFKLFSSYLHLGASSATILYPEITDYMGSIEGGINYNEI